MYGKCSTSAYTKKKNHAISKQIKCAIVDMVELSVRRMLMYCNN